MNIEGTAGHPLSLCQLAESLVEGGAEVTLSQLVEARFDQKQPFNRGRVRKLAWAAPRSKKSAYWRRVLTRLTASA
jgi:hypothetical protein